MNVVHEDVKQCVENELQHAVSVFGLHHILCIVSIAIMIGIEYGRYLLFGDGMDFWKFWWIDTTFRR